MVELDVDLGFGVRSVQRFLVPQVEDGARIHAELSGAHEMLVKSYRVKHHGVYLGDITYRVGNVWYNLTHKIVMEEDSAREQDELASGLQGREPGVRDSDQRDRARNTTA